MNNHGHAAHFGRKATSGFTLVEVLVAMAILVVLMTLIYGSFATTLRAPEEVGDIQDRYIALGRAMDRMVRDIEMAYLSAHYNSTYEDSPKYIFKLADNRLDFTAFAHLKMVKDANESDQCELSYFLREDRDVRGSQDLVRREDPRIDKDPEHGGNIYPLLRDVVDLKFEVWNGDEWAQEWDSSKIENKDTIPQRLRIWVTIYDENREKRSFVTEVMPRLRKVVLLK